MSKARLTNGLVMERGHPDYARLTVKSKGTYTKQVRWEMKPPFDGLFT